MGKVKKLIRNIWIKNKIDKRLYDKVKGAIMFLEYR